MADDDQLAGTIATLSARVQGLDTTLRDLQALLRDENVRRDEFAASTRRQADNTDKDLERFAGDLGRTSEALDALKKEHQSLRDSVRDAQSKARVVLWLPTFIGGVLAVIVTWQTLFAASGG